MKLKSIFKVVVVEVNEGEEIRFNHTIYPDKSSDLTLIRDNEPDPIDLYTEEEIRMAEEIAHDEISKRNI